MAHEHTPGMRPQHVDGQATSGENDDRGFGNEGDEGLGSWLQALLAEVEEPSRSTRQRERYERSGRQPQRREVEHRCRRAFREMLYPGHDARPEQQHRCDGNRCNHLQEKPGTDLRDGPVTVPVIQTPVHVSARQHERGRDTCKSSRCSHGVHSVTITVPCMNGWIVQM